MAGAGKEISISVPGQPTRPRSEETGYHLYLSDGAHGTALKQNLLSITPNGLLIPAIGAAVRAELDRRGLRSGNIAMDMPYIMMRTTYPTNRSLGNPLGWDTRLENAKLDAAYYEYHPYRNPQPVRLGDVIGQAQDEHQKLIHQVSVEGFQTVDDAMRYAAHVAYAFASSSFEIQKDGTLASPGSWGKVAKTAVTELGGARWKVVPEAVGDSWKRMLPFSLDPMPQDNGPDAVLRIT